jgi:hypothetical protein
MAELGSNARPAQPEAARDAGLRRLSRRTVAAAAALTGVFAAVAAHALPGQTTSTRSARPSLVRQTPVRSASRQDVAPAARTDSRDRTRTPAPPPLQPPTQAPAPAPAPPVAVSGGS